MRHPYYVFSIAVGLFIAAISMGQSASTQDAQRQQMNAVVLAAAADIRFYAQLSKQAVEDSVLRDEQIARCKAALDDAANRVDEQYTAVKGTNTVPTELQRAVMAFGSVINDQVTDPEISHAIALQIGLEMQLSSVGTVTPLDATSTLRKYVAMAAPTGEQQKQIEAILRALQESVDKEIKSLDKNVAADRAEWEQIQKRLTPTSRKSWTDIRTVLTKDQRRSLNAQAAKRG